jgi:hypothetical protein
MPKTKFLTRVQPHVISEIIDFCKESYGNNLVGVWCGILGTGQTPNFQVELKNKKKFAHKGATKELDAGVEYDEDHLVQIWP